MAKKKAKSAIKNPPPGALATSRNDITIQNYNNVLSTLDDVLIERGGIEGLKIYERIRRDSHAAAVLDKRAHHLIAREWEIRPASESPLDIEAADFIKDLFNALPFDQICLELLDATLMGFAVSEIIWTRDGRHFIPDAIKNIDQRRFVFDLDMKPRLLTRAAPLHGEELPDRKFIVHRFGMRGNNAYGLGLGARLFWPVLFKREGVAFWMTFLERFASPIPVGKYPFGSTPQQRRDLDVVLAGISNASSISVPIGTDLETFESSRSGQSDYHPWLKFWNAEISKAVTGETLSTEMGENGARAASQTHSDILDKLIDSDADLLSGTMNNQLIAWLTAANYPNANPPTVWRPRPSNESELEAVGIQRAERQNKQIAVLSASRAEGYEPEDVGAFFEEVFGCPVKPVKPPQEAQKKSQKSPLTPQTR